MRDFGDISLANLPEPRSVEEVAAIAMAVEKAAERRYAAFGHDPGSLNSPAVAALLKDIGGEHKARASRLEETVSAEVLRDIVPKRPTQLLPQLLSEHGTAACDRFSVTPYGALAFAVSLAQQTFTLYSYLAATADDKVRDYAERLAGEELARAARLRVERRRAYHAERRQPKTEGYPAAPLVESQADLLAGALVIEGRLAQRLTEAGEKEPGLSSACEATRQRVEELRHASAQAGEPGGPMTEELAKFSSPAQTNAQTDRDRSKPSRHLLADCERAFTFYDAVASAPVDEAVMLQAQDLSQSALERIRQVHATADAPGETGRTGD